MSLFGKKYDELIRKRRYLLSRFLRYIFYNISFSDDLFHIKYLLLEVIVKS